MRKSAKIYYSIFIFLFFISCEQKEKEKTSSEVQRLNYPSASSVEFNNGKLYVLGDDATDLLILDSNLNILDSFPIFSYPARPIPKDIKPDLEASAFSNITVQQVLYLFSSGS